MKCNIVLTKSYERKHIYWHTLDATNLFLTKPYIVLGLFFKNNHSEKFSRISFYKYQGISYNFNYNSEYPSFELLKKVYLYESKVIFELF